MRTFLHFPTKFRDGIHLLNLVPNLKTFVPERLLFSSKRLPKPRANHEAVSF